MSTPPAQLSLGFLSVGLSFVARQSISRTSKVLRGAKHNTPCCRAAGATYDCQAKPYQALGRFARQARKLQRRAIGNRRGERTQHLQVRRSNHTAQDRISKKNVETLRLMTAMIAAVCFDMERPSLARQCSYRHIQGTYVGRIRWGERNGSAPAYVQSLADCLQHPQVLQRIRPSLKVSKLCYTGLYRNHFCKGECRSQSMSMPITLAWARGRSGSLVRAMLGRIQAAHTCTLFTSQGPREP